MLRKFKITIDGKEYLVEMEEIGAPSQASVAPPVQPAVAPAPVAEKGSRSSASSSSSACISRGRCNALTDAWYYLKGFS